MINHFKQNFVRTIRVTDKKPVIAELIVDRKLMPAKIEIEPHFQNAVGDKFDYFRTFELFNVVCKFVKKDGFRQINKMPRTIVHPHIK